MSALQSKKTVYNSAWDEGDWLDGLVRV